MNATTSGEREARLLLTHVAEPGDTALGRLLTDHAASDVVAALRAESLPDLAGDDSQLAVKLAEKQTQLRQRLGAADPEADLRAAARVDAHFVIPGELDWPNQLDDLAERRPVGIWARGRIDLRPAAIRSVAVVGARQCSPYGQDVAAMLAGGLAAAGWLVVSGAAYGIDAAAHRGALSLGGATAAILACGVDHAYPRGHDRLLDAIADSGAIIAELPPGTHPNRFRFIERNRLIAALTPGTVVVEAALRSGALVTARQAERLGRAVMGVPGPVTSGCAEGVHRLIRDGAILVTDPAEIIEHVGDLGADLAPLKRPIPRPRDRLDQVAARVLESLPRGRGETLLAVARETVLDPASVHAALGRLCAEGWAERADDGWRAVHRS
jgi:DNA processing protein